MCNKCIYKCICKFIVNELSKDATDPPCRRFKSIPLRETTESEDDYLVQESSYGTQ